MKTFLTGAAVVPLLLLSASSASAAVPDPYSGEPGCVGRLVAVTTLNSGQVGASGNPKAAAGVGYFSGSYSAEIIALARQADCPTG